MFVASIAFLGTFVLSVITQALGSWECSLGNVMWENSWVGAQAILTLTCYICESLHSSYIWSEIQESGFNSKIHMSQNSNTINWFRKQLWCLSISRTSFKFLCGVCVAGCWVYLENEPSSALWLGQTAEVWFWNAVHVNVEPREIASSSFWIFFYWSANLAICGDVPLLQNKEPKQWRSWLCTSLPGWGKQWHCIRNCDAATKLYDVSLC